MTGAQCFPGSHEYTIRGSTIRKALEVLLSHWYLFEPLFISSPAVSMSRNEAEEAPVWLQLVLQRLALCHQITHTLFLLMWKDALLCISMAVRKIDS